MDEDVAGGVAEEHIAMAAVGDDAAVQSRQREGNIIPFEVVGDDEMAAIEAALLQAHSVSVAFRSAKPDAILINRITNGLRLSSNPPSGHSTQFLASQKISNSFRYTVASESWSTLASVPNVTAQNRTLSSSYSSAICRGEDVGSESVSSEPGDRQPSALAGSCEASRVEEAAVVLSQSNGTSSQDQFSTPCSSLDPDDSQVSSSDNLSSVSAASEPGNPESQSTVSQDMEDMLGKKASMPSSGWSDERKGESGKRRSNLTLLHYKSGRALAVTDFTASEWCEKQVEFSLNRGKPEQTPAMKAGSARHAELEKEVVVRVEIEIHTREDTWAVRLLNFITGARQLLSEGLTRELPVLGAVGDTWVVGIIDEIRLVRTEYGEQPLLTDTKTRRRMSPPSEPQKRNARLQLMCYKLLWDTMVETGIPSVSFFEHFRLNPRQKLCQDVRSHAATFWESSEVSCLQDLASLVQKEVKSRIYPKSVGSLILRYELQADHSLLGEDEFYYEHDWLMGRWQWHSGFWGGQRAASFVPDDETWKCRFCSFADICSRPKDPIGECTKVERPGM